MSSTAIHAQQDPQVSRRWSLLPALFAVLASVALAGVLVYFDGEPFVGGAFLAVLLVVSVTLYRLDWGFATMLFMVLLFDQFRIPGFETMTLRAGYHYNISTIAYLPDNTIVVTPLELHLAFLLFVWLVVAAVRRGDVPWVPIPLKLPLAALVAALLWGLARGIASGGDFVIALWEVRGLGYLVLVFVFLPQVIRTREQVRLVMWAAIAGISVKALQGAIRYAGLGFSFGWWPNIYETLTNHEDPVFMVTLFMFLFALFLFKATDSQKAALLALFPILFLGFVSGQRRAAYASATMSMAVVVLALPSEVRKKTLVGIAVFSVFFAVYLSLFWTSYSRVGYVAQQFKATFTSETGVRGQKDIESTRAREIENFNLASSYKAEPLGRGFGIKFDTPMTMTLLDVNKLAPYIPHNQIFWVFVKTGVVGALFFWFFFNAAFFTSARAFFILKDPYFRAVALVCVVAVINQLTVAFADMQITWYRTMIYLGVLIALPPVMLRVEQGVDQAR